MPFSEAPSPSSLPRPGGPFRTFWLGDPRHDWQALVQARVPRLLRRGELLYPQGAPVAQLFVVLRGRVRLVRYAAEGRERHLMVIGPQGLLGDEGGVEAGQQVCAAVASSEASVVGLPWAQAQQLLQADAKLLQQYLAFSGQRMQALLLHHELLSQGGASRRVATALLGLLHTHGQAHAEGWLIRLVFTQEEMASLCSLSRMSVSSVMGDWARQGVLEREGRFYLVRRLSVLQDCAQV